jgi:NAD(P)-dependent dehydrogenase (short-subunit alcohol dehydrogenase family)
LSSAFAGDEQAVITPLSCELTNHDSVRAAADEIAKQFQKIDIVVCNAGIMALPAFEAVEGYEKQFMTNHIGHFLLLNL